jgi:alkaline phosphatase D
MALKPFSRQKNFTIDLSRRTLLASGARLASVALSAPFIASCAGVGSSFAQDPFTLGVASGDPLPDGVVLWTRLAPEPLAGGGMPAEPVPVVWEIAADEGFRRIIQRGIAIAVPEWAHAVHVDVRGLAPGHWYWYRFHANGVTSPIGRTRTAPMADAAVDRLRFAFASCQHYEQGYYGAYRHMAREDIDLVFHLGDYIYEESSGRGQVRQHEGPELTDLAGYRNRYARYKTDPDLQAAHAAFPWATIWDDHEVDNDYAGLVSENLDPPEVFRARRAAAYKAYLEHLPLRLAGVFRGEEVRIYRRLAFGNLAAFCLLDDRQYRDPQPCPPPGYGGSNFVEDCAERPDPRRTILGAPQERWLLDGLGRSRARWNVIAQQTPMAQRDTKPGPGQRLWTDGWDGYPAARRRILDFLAARRDLNPVVIGGDVHAYWVSDLKPDFDDPRSPVAASEFVGTSITSQSGSYERASAALPDNPHVRFFDNRQRGYVRVELTQARARVDLRAVDSVASRDVGIANLRSFVVEPGRPGALVA